MKRRVSVSAWAQLGRWLRRQGCKGVARPGGGSERRGVLNFEVYRVPKSFASTVPVQSSWVGQEKQEGGTWVAVVGGEGRTTHPSELRKVEFPRQRGPVGASKWTEMAPTSRSI